MRVHRFFALLFAALALTMTSAHVLEMPQKLSYDLELYTAVNSSMYRYFAIVGGSYQIVALLAVVSLAWRTRDGWMRAAAIGTSLAFLSWLLLVQPVNSAIAEGASWAQLRMRWEVGHLVGFVLSLAGFIALAIATVREIPERTAAWTLSAPRATRSLAT